jgi:predicted nucleic acid-binding protein
LKLYLDTSALAKRYIEEQGSKTVLEKCAQADEIMLSPLSVPEMISVFNRLREERKIPEDSYLDIKNNFLEDLTEVVFLEMNQEILLESVECIEKTGLKTLDAIHVATAQKMKCDLFMTSDHQQKKAAKSMGLKVLEV